MTSKAKGGITDPELAVLVAAWPTLPDPIRTAIRALLGTVPGVRRAGEGDVDNWH